METTTKIKSVAVPTSDADVEVIPDQLFSSPNGRSLMADLYLPRASLRPLPVIVYLHGGGWRIGDRRLAPDLKRFFARSGFAMASIEYRLSGEAIFPAALEDVKTAVRWLKSCAGRYGLDSGRVGLWGSSAGGHLASLCAATGPGAYEGKGFDDQSSSVQAVVDGYGPTDFLQEDAHRDPQGKPSDDPESLQLPSGKHSEDPDSLEALFLGAPILTVPELVAEANPITHIRHGMPPYLIMHGMSDTMVPYNQSELLFRALARSGGEASLVLIERLGHGFFDRNNLDDAGEREVRVWRCRDGVANGPAVERRLLFGEVEGFFHQHLSA